MVRAAMQSQNSQVCRCGLMLSFLTKTGRVVPASFSSGLASSLMGGMGEGLYSCSTLLLSGENDRFGSGGISTRSMISCGGFMYPVLCRPAVSFASAAEACRINRHHGRHDLPCGQPFDKGYNCTLSGGINAPMGLASVAAAQMCRAWETETSRCRRCGGLCCLLVALHDRCCIHGAACVARHLHTFKPSDTFRVCRR